MPTHRTAVHVVIGATGSGKTRLIAALLKQRSGAEHRAVLTNDFGTTSLGGSAPSLLQNVTLREVAGCACCTGQLVLRTALVTLLRERALDRVVIEASAAAEPAALSRLLAEPNLASALDVRPLVATANIAQLLDTRYLNAPVYREQLKSADIVVLTVPEGAGDEEYTAARAALAEIISPATRVIENPQQLELEMLDSTAQPLPFKPSR